ncbi:hypothetical protein VTK73DRAFT_3998 [Phialemonium thermophilum]|uniref:Acyl-CoA thioesterase-like N-terminal HotDog domain-containing protein n=1 Tax=Phialemonium thermophilum TaxID=223376 RepID=A0ABR3WWE9_9PEZI
MPPQYPDPRLSFQEAMEVVELTPGQVGSRQSKWYMSKRPAHLPGSDLPLVLDDTGAKVLKGTIHKAAFGGCVYAQAALSTCRTLAAEESKEGLSEDQRLDLHSVHGYFTAKGYPDRPFLYSVSPVNTSNTFRAFSVTVHQTTVPSPHAAEGIFPPSDANLPLGPPCFTAITAFKRPEPDSAGISMAEEPPQERFASILSSRDPSSWPPSPPVDIDLIVDLFGRETAGTFPCVEMRKVDMTAYNEGRPIHEHRELLLYRLLQPLPADGSGDRGGWDANAHALVHAFTVDRNGLLMALNHLGLGQQIGRVASLSYSFVVHVNTALTVMNYDDPGWWIQEASFPRAAAGRAVIMSKVWSPSGVHIATEYQDGLCRAYDDSKARARLDKL